MKTSVINVKTDKDIKKSAQRVAEELGLSLSTVINAYLRQFVRNKEIHLSAAPHMSAELEEFLRRLEAMQKTAGPNTEIIISPKGNLYEALRLKK